MEEERSIIKIVVSLYLLCKLVWSKHYLVLIEIFGYSNVISLFVLLWWTGYYCRPFIFWFSPWGRFISKSFTHFASNSSLVFWVQNAVISHFPYMTLKQIKVHGACFGFNTQVLVTVFNCLLNNLIMRNVHNDDRNCIKDVKHLHIKPEKQCYYFWMQYCTPHTFKFYVYIFWCQLLKSSVK